MIASDGERLYFGNVNGFQIEIHDEDTELLSFCALIYANSGETVIS